FKLFLQDFIENDKPHLRSGNTTSIGSNPGPQVCAFLGYGSRDTGAFHFSFVIHYDPSIVFKV
ncbi:hypothetical protein MZO44_17160, partial [Lactiplantibacillus sp. E932]|nr:hypothetical protein [Lactiplantibacillus sp. E932]